MSNATQSLAGTRITSLLDANSFVEIGQGVTARSTDFNMPLCPHRSLLVLPAPSLSRSRSAAIPDYSTSGI